MSDFNRILSNVQKMADKGAPPEHINDYLHQEGLTAYQFKAHIEGMQQAGKIESLIKYSAPSGVANLLDMGGRGLTGAYNLEQMGKGLMSGKPQDNPTVDPSTLDFANRGFRKLGIINDDYAPTSTGGKVADSVTQALFGGGVNPFALARNAVRGMAKPIVRDITAAGASGAGAAVGNLAGENINTGNTSLDNALKIGTTLVGGMTPGGMVALRGTAGDRAAAAVNGVTEDQMALARELKRKAAANGSPITDYEAIQAKTGLNPKMQTQQRLAEQSDAAAKTLTPIMQNRPKANSIMFDKTADSISPLEQDPQTLAGILQKAAQESITKQRIAGNTEAKPYYDKASVKILSPAQESATVFDPAINMAIERVTKDPLSSVYGMPKNTVGVIDAAKKYLDDIKNKSTIAGENNRAANAGSAARNAVAIGDAAAPNDYPMARQIVADNMQNNVVPMEQGQVGKLSRSDKFATQSQELLPDQPADITPSVVSRTAQTIGEQDPDIIKRFLAQDLRRKFSEANQRQMGGEPTGGGAKFAANVAGNADQEANLMQAIQSSGAPHEPFQDALDIFRAQGYKPGVNSATFSNADEATKLGGWLSALSSPTKAIPSFIDSYRNGGAVSDIANAISAQDGTGPMRIEQLARINGMHDPMKQQMLINLLMGNPQNQ